MLSHLFCQRCLNGQLYQFSVANFIVVENTPCLTQIFYEKLPSTLKIFYLQLEFRILTPCLGHHRCLVENTCESYLYNSWIAVSVDLNSSHRCDEEGTGH